MPTKKYDPIPYAAKARNAVDIKGIRLRFFEKKLLIVRNIVTPLFSGQ